METACRLPDDETQWSLLRQTESCWRAVRVFQGAGHPGSYTEIDCKLPDSCDKLLRSLSKLRGPLAGCHAVFGAAWPGFYRDCRLLDGCDNVPWSSSKLRGPLAVATQSLELPGQFLWRLQTARRQGPVVFVETEGFQLTGCQRSGARWAPSSLPSQLVQCHVTGLT